MLKNIFPKFFINFVQISKATGVNNRDNYQAISQKGYGIYIHVPYCRKKCIYCDFFSGGNRDTDWALFTDSIINELSARMVELNGILSTLYIGGGTPSLMPESEFRRLTEMIGNLTGKRGDWNEFTIEVNPEDFNDEKCRVWKDSGVNRVSMGIQSLDDGELKRVGRNHDAATSLRAYETLRRYFDNISVDVIFGLPGQSIESWKRTIEGVIELKPAHISAYSLMFEEHTAITILRDAGRMSFPDESECVMMWQLLSQSLNKAGYRQYEISNYAKEGFEAIHNKSYWTGKPYLGLGPSAHSYDGGRIRRSNPQDLHGYLQRFGDKDKNNRGEQFYEEEILSDTELLEEMVMLSLRIADGLDLKEFEKRFGRIALQKILKQAERGIASGRLLRDSNRLRLSSSGIMVSDEIILSLL